MKKVLIASLLVTAFTGIAFAQAQPAPAGKPAAKKAAAKGATKPPTRREAIEVSTPLEENDPADKLNAAELEVAKRVYTGEIKCELGAHVKVTPRRRAGYFLVSHGINRFVMHPVESKTGAIRLEDPVRGALWLQLGNKSMLMNQKEGKRLADECASPEQLDFAKNMKPVNLLEPAPAAAAAAPAAAASATAAAPAAAAPAAAAPASAAADTTAAPAAPAAPAAAPAAPAAVPANTPAPAAPSAAAPSAAPAPAQ